MFKSRGGLVCPLLALVLSISGGISANAQQVFGNIYGTITDGSGAAVTTAKITITDTAKGTQFVVQSDASGNYAKGQLVPDPYTVEVESAGFSKVVSQPRLRCCKPIVPTSPKRSTPNKLLNSRISAATPSPWNC